MRVERDSRGLPRMCDKCSIILAVRNPGPYCWEHTPVEDLGVAPPNDVAIYRRTKAALNELSADERRRYADGEW